MGRSDSAFLVSEDRPHSPRFNRRVVLKAAAILGAMAAGHSIETATRPPTAIAAETSAYDWYEADELGAVGGASGSDPIVVETQFPFTAVGAHWAGEAGAWPVVKLQISYDGATWSEPFTLDVSPDGGQSSRDGRIFTGLVCATGATHLAYAVFDGDGNRVTVPEFALTYIDSRQGPDLPAVGAANTDRSSPPRIVTRAEWGANESYRFTEGGEWWTPRYQTVRHAIVHHSETSNVENPTQAMRAIYYYHAVTRGWHDIGYNYLVDRFGNIYQGRAGGQNIVGGHAFEYSQGSSGICFIGNHIFAEVTSSALAGMVAILAWAIRFQAPWSRASFHGIPNLPTICGHRDVLNTQCPGDFAYGEMEQIRSLVAQTLATAGSGPVAGLVAGDYVVTGSSVNLRTNAGLSGGVIRLLDAGTHGMVDGGPVAMNGMAWYRVVTDYGAGWAAADNLTRRPPTDWKRGRFGRDQVVALSSSANLRRLPSINSDLIRGLDSGAVASILGGPEDADGHRWYKVNTAQGQGWIAASFLAPSNAAAPPAAPQNPGGGGRFSSGQDVTVSDGPVNMRSSAGTSASIVRSLAQSTRGTIVDGPVSSSGYAWYRLSTSLGSGWVAGDFLSAAVSSGSFAVGDQVVVSDGPLNIRSSAGTGSSIVTQLATGASGSIIAGPATASGYTWYRLQTTSGTGWAAQNFLRRGTASSNPPPSSGGAIFNTGDDTVVASGPLNLRSSASTSAGIIAQLANGARCVIRGGPVSSGGYSWYQVSSGGRTGWVAGNFLAHGPRAGSSVSVFTGGDGGLRIRSSAGTGAAVVTTLPEGTTATVLAGPQSANGYTWWRIQSQAGTGWAAGAFLIPG